MTETLPNRSQLAIKAAGLNMETFHPIEHPLVEHKISLMRQADVRMSKFYDLTRELGVFLGIEITQALRTQLVEKKVDHFPGGSSLDVREIDNKEIAIVPVLRSGLVLAEGFREIVRSVRTGHLGFTRDEMSRKVEPYLVALPQVEGRTFIVLDTVVGTGYTACRAIEVLRTVGVPFSHIKIATILLAPEGARMIQEKFPEVHIYALWMEDGLDTNGSVVPGFGDSSDRLFGFY